MERERARSRTAVHLLEGRRARITEKYSSCQKEKKKQFPAITEALLYLVNLNKRGYLYLSNLIKRKNSEDFSIHSVPFLAAERRRVRNSVAPKKDIGACYSYFDNDQFLVSAGVRRQPRDAMETTRFVFLDAAGVCRRREEFRRGPSEAERNGPQKKKKDEPRFEVSKCYPPKITSAGRQTPANS